MWDFWHKAHIVHVAACPFVNMRLENDSLKLGT